MERRWIDIVQQNLALIGLTVSEKTRVTDGQWTTPTPWQ